MKVIKLPRGLYGVYSPLYSDDLREIGKETPGMVWDPSSRSWVGYPDAVMVVASRLRQEHGIRVDVRALPKPASKAKELPTLLPVADKGMRDYQQFGTRFLIDQAPTGAILADVMGVGKSIQAARAARAFKRKTLIVCPSYARGVWRRPKTDRYPGELAKWWSKAMPAALLEGVTPASRIVRATKKQLELQEGLPCYRGKDGNYEGLPVHATVAITHYEVVYAWVDAILAWAAKGGLTVIFDEIHQAGTPRSRMWRALRRLSEFARGKIGLTGTPLQNHPQDLFNVAELLSPGRFSNPMKRRLGEREKVSFYDFGIRHCGGHQEQVTPEKIVYVYNGKTHKEELKARLEYMMLRRTKADVKLELPPKERQVLDVDVPPNAQIIAPAEAFKKSKMARKCLDLAANAKLPKVLELLEGHAAQGLRVVCATWRRNIAEWICKQLLKRKIACNFVHGGVSQRNRDQRIDIARGYREKGKAHVLVVTLASTKSAIDLSYADVGVVVEFSWNPQDHLQWESRIHRFGSTSARSLFQYIVGRGTTDEIVVSKILKKMEMAKDYGQTDEDGFADDLDTAARGEAALAELYEDMVKELAA